MTVRTWTLYVTDWQTTRRAQIDEYESAEIIERISDVSSWTITLPSDTEAAQIFMADTRARLEVAVDDQVWTSGPITQIERTVDLDGDMLTVAGADDTIWLARRLAHPQPGTSHPPYVQAYDTRSGATSTVIAAYVRANAGPNATLERKVPSLTVPEPVPAGPNITVSARWQNLLTLLQDIARPAGLVFDIVDLAFHVWQPVDNGVVFSAGLETLAGYAVTSPGPAANKIIVGGGGELGARIILERPNATSISDWGLAEAFQDRRDTTDLTELTLAGDETLARSIPPTSVVFTPLDTEAQTFIRDWNLGDLVTVVAGGLTVHDQIREIHVTLDSGGATVVPSIGTAAGDIALFRSLAGFDRRVRQLERI